MKCRKRRADKVRDQRTRADTLAQYVEKREEAERCQGR